MSWSDFAETVCKWERIEGRYRRLVAKEALGTITPEESRKLERYTALRRSRIPPETREARVRAYRDRLLRKALTTIALGRAPHPGGGSSSNGGSPGTGPGRRQGVEVTGCAATTYAPDIFVRVP